MKQSTTGQKNNWSKVYEKDQAFFGEEPSEFAKRAMYLFKKNGFTSLLELGFGQGRDTLYFAHAGLNITALDYSQASVTAIESALPKNSIAKQHDVRKLLPFPDHSFDACYSHMLLCMELSSAEISSALSEIFRVIKPGGLVLYSVRSVHDSYYKKGIHLGEKMYEAGDFTVHFFSEEMIQLLSGGFAMLSIDRLEEGSQPRDLYAVAMQKTGPVYESCLSKAFSVNDALRDDIPEQPGRT